MAQTGRIIAFLKRAYKCGFALDLLTATCLFTKMQHPIPTASTTFSHPLRLYNIPCAIVNHILYHSVSTNIVQAVVCKLVSF